MFELLRRKSVVVSIILFGAAGGAILGVYVRDNWDIEARVCNAYMYILVH